MNNYKTKIISVINNAFSLIDDSYEYENGSFTITELIPCLNAFNSSIKNYIKISSENFTSLREVNLYNENHFESITSSIDEILCLVDSKPMVNKEQKIKNVLNSIKNKNLLELKNSSETILDRMENEIVRLFDASKSFFSSFKQMTTKNDNNLQKKQNDDSQNLLYQTEIDILKENLSKKEKELMSYKAKNMKLINESTSLKAIITESKKEKEKIIINSKSLASSLKDLIKETSSMKTEIAELKSKNMSIGELKRQYDKVIKEKAMLTNELIDQNCKMTQYKVQYEKLLESSNSQETKPKISRNSIVDILQNKSEEKKDDFEGERILFANLSKKIEDLKKEINELKKECENAGEKEKLEKKKLIEEKKTILLKSHKELISLKKKIFEKDKNHPQPPQPQPTTHINPVVPQPPKESEEKKKNEEYELKEKEIMKLKKDNEELNIANKTLIQKTEMLNNENIKFALVASKKEEVISDKEAIIAKLLVEKEELESEINKMKKEIEDKEKEINEKEQNKEEKSKIINEKESLINDLKEENFKLINEKDSLIDKLKEEKNKILKEKEISINILKEEQLKIIKEKEASINSFKEENEKTSKEKENIINKLNQEIENIKVIIQEKEKEISNLSIQTNKLLGDVEILSCDKNGKQEKEKIHIENINDVHKEINLLQEHNKKMCLTIKSLVETTASIIVNKFDISKIVPEKYQTNFQIFSEKPKNIQHRTFPSNNNSNNDINITPQISTLQERIKQLESNYSSAKDLIASLKANNEETSKLLNENIEKNKKLQAKLDEVNSSFSESDRASFSKLQQSIMMLVQTIAPNIISLDFTSNDSSVTNYIDLVGKFEEECSKKEAKTKKYKDTLVKMNKVLTEKKKEIANLLTIQTELLEKLSKREMEFENYKSQMRALLSQSSPSKNQKNGISSEKFEQILKTFLSEEEKYKKDIDNLKQENEKMKKTIANNNVNDSILNISTSSNPNENDAISRSGSKSNNEKEKEQYETEKLLQDQLILIKEQLKKTQKELEYTKKSNENSLNLIKNSFSKILGDVLLSNENKQFLAMVMKVLGYSDTEVKETLKKNKKK